MPGWAAATGYEPKGSVDAWYVDDGQAVVRPELAETWLRSLDRAIEAIGGHRAKAPKEPGDKK